jgi:hypothetical protein
MDLEDLFNRDHRSRKRGYRDHENKHGHYGDRHDENRHALFDRDHHDDNDQRRKHGDQQYNHHNDDLFNLSHLLPRLLANKKILITAGILVLAIIVIAIVVVLPLFGQAIDFISKSGLQSVIDRLLQLTGGAK